jgi:hypothetical protein
MTDGTPYPSREESEKRELERIEDLMKSAKLLIDRAAERMGIESANWRRLQMLGFDARVLIEAAARVLERL